MKQNRKKYNRITTENNKKIINKNKNNSRITT